MSGNAGDVDEYRTTTAPRDAVGVDESSCETDFDYADPSYLDMIGRSLLSKGNNVRLKRAIEKAKQGEPVVMAYIGGSITHGAGAAPIHLRSYAYRSYDRFKLLFAPSDTNFVRLVKAGVGGTPSELGVVRYDRDVLEDGHIKPDIVIIEFAVNDADDETQGNCYESLVLKALAHESEPAVILLFSVFENDWNLQDRLAPVGWHYQLPMVSMKDALVEQFQRSRDEGNIVTKAQYFHDIYHPTNLGHQMMADALGNLFEVTDLSEPDLEELVLDKPPLIGNDFVDVKLLDRKNVPSLARIETGGFSHTDTDLQITEMHDHDYGTPLFPDNWMYIPRKTADRNGFKLNLQCKRLIMIFKDSGSEQFGTARIKVDGEFFTDADPRQVNWTHCHALLLLNEMQASEHTIEIEMAEGHEEKQFTILGFGYVE